MRRSCYNFPSEVTDKAFELWQMSTLICSNSFSLDISEMFRTWWKSMRFKLELTLLYNDLDSLSSLLTTSLLF